MTEIVAEDEPKYKVIKYRCPYCKKIRIAKKIPEQCPVCHRKYKKIKAEIIREIEV